MGVLKAKRDGKTVAYRLDKAAVIVGSGENCNIRVADAGLVARHCQILKMENGFVLRDMSGEVGTFVNGKKVKEHLLSDRDLIQLGKERFTFSISEGENTARVAVSVAPGTASVPKSGNTSRVAAAAPARSGNTGRIAAPAPKTERAEAPGRNTGRIAAPAAAEGGSRPTQRVNKAATQRTATVQKSTGRIEGGTKKITARSAAAMGYQTERKMLNLPTTRKGKMIAIGGVLFIALLGATLWFFKSQQVNPDAIKQTMAAELAELRKLKPDQVIEIDNGYEKILAEHEPVKKYVMQMYSNIDKEHVKVHQIASDLKKAAKDVKPFLDRYAALKAKGEHKAQAQTLYDECKSQLDNYGNTVFGDQMREIQKELQGILADTGPSWEQGMVGLQSEVRSEAKKGNFVAATKAIDAYGEKFKEKEVLELFKKLGEQRDFLKRESQAFVKREAEKAQKDLAAEGAKKDEIKKRLEGFKPGLEGYKEALEKLDAAIAGIK
ncbi:MAG: FHA domain-containing protein [Planctomycetaceae bacterium]|nr:FHA domain-containing protein [Planctomycetaceae bacterium]